MTIPDARQADRLTDFGVRHDEAVVDLPADGLPYVEELRPAPDVVTVFRRLSKLPHCIFFDSARRDREIGRYSFIAADPFDYFEAPISRLAADPLDEIARRLGEFKVGTVAGLPPFQGGAAGLISYDFARCLERRPLPRCDEFGVPAIAIGFYDIVIAFDHVANRAFLISQGFPEQSAPSRSRRARARAEQFRELIQSATEHDSNSPLQAERRVDVARLSKQYAMVRPELPQLGENCPLTSNFSREQYIETVARAIEYIRAGDIFQVNLSQRLLCPAIDDSVSLCLRLRERNAAPLAGYFDLGEFQIVSASPERFLRVADRKVEGRPIKGTRRRTARPEADLFAGDDLRQSEKDNAENVMIVDLLRNDLSRVCRPDSVFVSELCRLEVYEFVQHLVSIVRGELAEGRSALDLLRAAFPGGSVTGAPKIRAMQIIAELEPNARGAYCGGLGYLGFDGSMDFNILIRTITAGRGWWQMPVGGGIVAQSDPQLEYEETWHKAEGLLRALSP
jgi:para-aminobenzoate synthetase component 1